MILHSKEHVLFLSEGTKERQLKENGQFQIYSLNFY